MRPFCLAIVTLSVILPSATAEDATLQGSDWPQWRGPHRDAISTETGLLRRWPKEGPALLWDSSVANKGKNVGVGYSSVAVADGRIFTMGDQDRDGFAFALDEATGKVLWATRVGPRQGDGPRSTPTVDGDRVYTLTRQGDLHCLDVKTGAIHWHKSFKRDFGGRMMSGWDYSESPLVDGDRLVCTPGGDDAALVALDKRSGAVLWKSKIKNAGGAGYASIVVAEVGSVRLYITLLGKSRGLVGVRAGDGQLLWTYNRMANGTANIPTPLVKGDLVFCSTGYDGGSALLKLIPRSNGTVDIKEIYYLKHNVLLNHHGGMILLNGFVYGGHGQNAGLPFCLNLESGKFAWKPVRGAGSGSAAVVYADGCLYFRYDNNVMALIKATPDGYRLISQFQLPASLGTPGWQHPVIAHGKLFIRGRDRVICYDIRKH
jgi:outer membrane protein assembly factor BamB